jgi:hypothetical protein
MGFAIFGFLGSSFGAGFSNQQYHFDISSMFWMLVVAFPASIGVFIYYRKERFWFAKSLLAVPILLPIISIGYTLSSPSDFTVKDCHTHRDEYGCYEYFLEKSQSASICEGIDPSSASDAEEKCYATAVKQGLAGKDACEKAGWLRVECVENYIKKTKDWSACENLEVGWCFGWEVKQKKIDKHCKQSSSFVGRVCTMDEYISTNILTVESCKAFRREEDADALKSCITKFALKEKDFSLCELIPVNKKWAEPLLYQQACLSSVAPHVDEITKNYCRNLYPEKRPFCYTAIYYQNINGIHQEKNDAEVCANIPGSLDKVSCLSSLAARTNNPLICQNMLDVKAKEYCLCVLNQNTSSC